MDLCLISPRFHPVIGGNENYLKNIAKYCSEYLEITVVTSNLKSEIQFLGKRKYIKNNHGSIPHNISIIRSKTLKNYLLRVLFYYNEFLNNRSELLVAKLTNQNLVNRKTNAKSINDKFYNRLIKLILFQKYFTNPSFSQVQYILNKIHSITKIKLINSSHLYLNTNLSAFQFSKKKKIPFVCTPLIHINPHLNEFLKPTFNYILKKSDAIIALTNFEKKFYTKSGIKGDKIYVIPPGIDPDDYENPDIEGFKVRYNIPRECSLVLFIGRKTYYKGIQNLIFALNLLIKNNKDIILLLIGPNTRDYLLFFSKLPHELKSHIIDLGVVSNRTISSALASCDVFVLPSLDDSYGIVYLEAWLFKKSVIGALEGNVSSVIENQINGILVPFKNIKMLALKIEEILNNNELRKNLGQNGHTKLKKSNLSSITGKKVLELYEKFL